MGLDAEIDSWLIERQILWPELRGIMSDFGRVEPGVAKGGGVMGKGTWKEPSKSVLDYLQSGARLDLSHFRSAVEIGTLDPIFVKARGENFIIQGLPTERQMKKSEAAMSARATLRMMDESYARVTLCLTKDLDTDRFFPTLTGALEVLAEMGAKRVQFELHSWRPKEDKKTRYKRPDISRRLKLAHKIAREEKMGVRREERG